MRPELSEGEEKEDVGGLESLVEGEGKGTHLLVGTSDGRTHTVHAYTRVLECASTTVNFVRFV